jgi:hypothetical protein
MAKENLLGKKIETGKLNEIKTMPRQEKSTPLTFRENVIKKIPLAISLSKRVETKGQI